MLKILAAHFVTGDHILRYLSAQIPKAAESAVLAETSAGTALFHQVQSSGDT